MMESDWTNSVLMSQTPTFGDNTFTQNNLILKNNKRTIKMIILADADGPHQLKQSHAR